MTRAPARAASWTQATPTPPLAPTITIVSPASSRARVSSIRCAVPYAAGRFRYPGEPDLAGAGHRLLYLKLAVPVAAPWDVLSYQDIHPAFPAASTLQQLYDDQEFEAYRALGQHCATELARAVSAAGAPLRVAPEPGRTAGAGQAEGSG